MQQQAASATHGSQKQRGAGLCTRPKCRKEREIENLALCRPKNKKDSCLIMITLKDTLGELFKMNVELTENFPRLTIDRCSMI